GVRLHVVAPERVSDLLAAATDGEWRERSRRYPGLARAGGAVVVTARVEDYLARYREPDKADSGLGGDPDAWPVPYWYVDAAMALMALLLLVEEAGLAATIWGNFRHADRVLALADAHDEELVATLLVGRPDGHDARSASLERDVPTRADRVRRID
ncbi:MAG TPA: hypothetical protein VGS61_05685, partial [Acidimicrobiales bacterium]|nr:hypothetical protein [Acidimicrobiales bacterium]